MITSNYIGNVDKLHFRVGQGVQQFNTKEGSETYNGPFVNDAYHGYGQYQAKNIFGEPWTYEGMFNVNEFHGYGTLSYADGSMYSGLFKTGRQFGPGVLTYSDGRQDVGLWFGSQLLRLSVTVHVIDKLCTTPYDRIQAAVFKKLVEIPSKDAENDLATEIMRGITNDMDLISQSHKLYARHCKHPESNLFDRKLFKDYSNKCISDLKNVMDDLIVADQNVKDDLTSYANVDAVRKTKLGDDEINQDDEHHQNDIYEQYKTHESSSDSSIFEPPVLLTWNNQDVIIDLMLHSFKYRRQECITNYDVGDILCQRRSYFASAGDKEEGSIQMLKASYSDDPRTVLRLLTTLRLNADVMDNRGNSMILLAAANDCRKVIQVLADIEANINSVNDEGFNALTHTLTRYLAMIHDIKDWSQGFMPPCKQDELEKPGTEWMTFCSKTSMILSKIDLSKVQSKRTFKQEKSKMKKQLKMNYVFNLKPKTQLSARKPSVPVVTDENEEQSVFDYDHTLRIKEIEKTFSLLLNIGVDVNGSITPAPLLTLSIFTQNISIIENVLKHGADANSRLNIDEGDLTPLHVIALLDPVPTNVQIVELLMKYGADLSLRTQKRYRKECWEYLLQYRRPGCILEGMTPLQTLILRPDLKFLDKTQLLDLCCILTCYSDNDSFLGLTTLGLAIAQKNPPLIKTILACSDVNINEKFDYYWGNPLTAYFIINGGSSSSSAYQTLNILLNNGADPLYYKVFQDNKNQENIINFVDKLENRLIDQSLGKGKQMRQLSISPTKGSNSKLNKSIAELKKKITIIKNVAKRRVESHIKGVLVRGLLYCMQKTLGEDPLVGELLPKILKYLWDWVEENELVRILSMNLQETEFSDGVALINALLVYANFPEVFHKKDITPNDISSFVNDVYRMKRKESEAYLPQSLLLQQIKDSVMKSNKNFLKPAEIDKEGHLYKVCYECLKRDSKCRLCSICELVYFCSLDCNTANVKDPATKHKCGAVFWGLPENQVQMMYKSQTSQAGEEEENLLDEASVILEGSKLSTPSIRSDNLSYSSEKDAEGSASGKLIKLSAKPLRKVASARSLKKTKSATEQSKTDVSHRSKKLKFRGSAFYRKIQASLTKKAKKKVGWRERLSIIAGDLSSDSGSEGGEKVLGSDFVVKDMKVLGPVCPEVQYSVLGEKAVVQGLWETHEKIYNFPLQDRFRAFLHSLNYNFDLDIEDFQPYLVYIPQQGCVVYKSYTELPFENYSFN